MQIQHFLDAEKFMKDLDWSPNDLDQAFLSQAGHHAYYSSLSHRAGLQLERFKTRLSIVEAKVDREIRDKATEEGEKLTEPLIQRTIDLDRRVIKARDNVNECTMIYRQCKDAVDAFRHRKDMIIQKGAATREEKKGALRMSGNDSRQTAKSAFEKRTGSNAVN